MPDTGTQTDNGRGLGFTSRVGAWSFRHPWYALAVWLLVLVAGVFAAGRVFAGLSDGDGPKQMESVQAYTVLNQGSKDGGTVLGVVDHVAPQSPEVQQQVTALAGSLAAVPGVAEVTTPYSPGATDLVAGDGTALVIKVKLADLDDSALRDLVTNVSADLHGFAGTLAAHGQPQATVDVGGGPVINIEANDQVQTDLSRAEELSVVDWGRLSAEPSGPPMRPAD